MNYKEMVMKAKAAGVTNEKKMWESIASFSDMLDVMKGEHPEMYWDFMRRQHEIMYGGHYDEMFAMYDVSMMKYTDKSGAKHTGAHWTIEQIESATAGMSFAPSVTRWDKYVGFNATYADLSKVFEDGDILKAGYALYFADEDWGSDTKIWDIYAVKEKEG